MTVGRIRVLWCHTDFRWLFVSQTISTTGDRIVLVALALLVMERTGSTADLGLVIAAQSAALTMFLLLGGVWADRLPRHRIMVSADLIRGGLHALLAVLIFTDTLTLAELVAIEVMFGAAEAFFQPAYAGLVPQTVPEHLIQDATAINRFAQKLAGFAGPTIATGLVFVFGTGTAFAVDASTFAVSACLLRLVTPRPRGDKAPRTSVVAEAREGFREVRTRPWVWVTVSVAAVYLVVAYAPYLVLGPAVATAGYGRAALWGWVVAAIGLGTAMGSLLALRWRPRRPLYTAILMTVPFAGLLLLAAVGTPFIVLLPVATGAGIGLALFDVWWSTALAQRVPPAALSRVCAYDQLGSYALLPLGFVSVGFLAEHIGGTTVMAVGGVLGMAVMLMALLPRDTRQLGQPDASVELRTDRVAVGRAAKVAT
jgi:MFS family permease